MRHVAIIALLALLACEGAALAGGRTGQAKSAEVLARRTAQSPRGAKEWGGTSMAYINKGQKEVRADLRRSRPGSEATYTAFGKNSALVTVRDIVGKHLGLTPGQLASKDRRHDRAVVKQLRRMLREVRAARASGRPFREAFPGSLATGYRELEGALAGEIDSIRARQDASRRTKHGD